MKNTVHNGLTEGDCRTPERSRDIHDDPDQRTPERSPADIVFDCLEAMVKNLPKRDNLSEALASLEGGEEDRKLIVVVAFFRLFQQKCHEKTQVLDKQNQQQISSPTISTLPPKINRKGSDLSVGKSCADKIRSFVGSRYNKGFVRVLDDHLKSFLGESDMAADIIQKIEGTSLLSTQHALSLVAAIGDTKDNLLQTVKKDMQLKIYQNRIERDAKEISAAEGDFCLLEILKDCGEICDYSLSRHLELYRIITDASSSPVKKPPEKTKHDHSDDLKYSAECLSERPADIVAEDVFVVSPPEYNAQLDRLYNSELIERSKCELEECLAEVLSVHGVAEAAAYLFVDMLAGIAPKSANVAQAVVKQGKRFCLSARRAAEIIQNTFAQNQLYRAMLDLPDRNDTEEIQKVIMSLKRGDLDLFFVLFSSPKFINLQKVFVQVVKSFNNVVDLCDARAEMVQGLLKERIINEVDNLRSLINEMSKKDKLVRYLNKHILSNIFDKFITEIGDEAIDTVDLKSHIKGNLAEQLGSVISNLGFDIGEYSLVNVVTVMLGLADDLAMKIGIEVASPDSECPVLSGATHYDDYSGEGCQVTRSGVQEEQPCLEVFPPLEQHDEGEYPADIFGVDQENEISKQGASTIFVSQSTPKVGACGLNCTHNGSTADAAAPALVDITNNL